MLFVLFRAAKDWTMGFEKQFQNVAMKQVSSLAGASTKYAFKDLKSRTSAALNK